MTREIEDQSDRHCCLVLEVIIEQVGQGDAGKILVDDDNNIDDDQHDAGLVMGHLGEHLSQRNTLGLVDANALHGEHRQSDVAEQTEDGEDRSAHEESVRIDLMGVVAVHDERHDIADDSGAGSRSDATGGGQRGLVARLARDGRSHRPIRDVDEGVEDAPSQVGDEGIDDARRHGEVPGSWEKEQNGGGGEWELHPHDPRGEPSALGHLGIVNEAADHDVDEGVDQSGGHEQRAHQGGFEAEHIGVEDHEERIHQVEGEIVSYVAERVTDHVANIEIASVHRLSLLALRRSGRH